jgi:hypothetical protein
MKPCKPRADEWLIGALLVLLLVATIGLDRAWVREARPVALVAHAPAAAATRPVVVATAASRHVSR